MHRSFILLLIAASAFAQSGYSQDQQGPADKLDAAVGTYIVAPMAAVLFYDVAFWDNHERPEDIVGRTTKRGIVAAYDAESGELTFQKNTETGGVQEQKISAEGIDLDGIDPQNLEIPFIVAWLVLGAVFFTIRMRFINLFGLKHAIDIVRGKYDDDEHDGDISHFEALSSALSATVGLGNIAGVAVAVSAGGPGAIFWMIVAGFFGMTSKFVECTLGQMYRVITPSGVSGGPMHYLKDGLKEAGLGPLGKVLGVVFAVLCVGGSFGGGNMFQANQAFSALQGILMDPVTQQSPLDGYGWLFGVVLAVLVALVIIGGIQRIGKAASFVVPIMCGVYLLACCWVLLANASQIPHSFGLILSEAFSFKAGFGGFLGVLLTGFRRAAFSNEAGVGSASIAHAAATTDEPIREGYVALLEPFIDTIIVCTMTGLTVVITGAYQLEGVEGVRMTAEAFGSVISWFPYVLTCAVMLFAFSTMISWSYYGERCFTLLFGEKYSTLYKVIFLVFVVIGSTISLNNVVAFSDLMILGMAFPNILGAVILSGHVARALHRYNLAID